MIDAVLVAAAFLVGVYVLALVLGRRRSARARTARRAQVWTVTPLPVIDTVPFDFPAARPLALRRAGTGLAGTEPACLGPRCPACPLYGCAGCVLALRVLDSVGTPAASPAERLLIAQGYSPGFAASFLDSPRFAFLDGPEAAPLCPSCRQPVPPR